MRQIRPIRQARVRALMCALTATLALGALGACTDDSAEPTATPSPSGTVTSTPSAAPGCEVGTFQVTGIDATEDTSTPLGAVRVTAAPGVLTLVIRADETWTLTADPSKPVILRAGDLSVQGTADGTVEGAYTRTGDTLDFTTQRTSGTVTAEVAGASRTFPLEQVARVVAPSGSTTVACGATDLTLGSKAVKLTLTRVADATATVTPTQTPSETPTPSAS